MPSTSSPSAALHRSGRYNGRSAEQRSTERRERLMAAAYDLLGTHGREAASVRGVCRHAGLTPRYFYESFQNIDLLLEAVFDRLLDQLIEVVLAAVAAAPQNADAKARAAIGAFIAHLTQDPRRVRVAFTESRGAEPLARRRADAVRRFAALIADEARSFYGVAPQQQTGTQAPRSSTIVDVAALMLAGGLEELLLAWLDGELAMSREQLIDACCALFVASGERAVALAEADR